MRLPHWPNLKSWRLSIWKTTKFRPFRTQITGSNSPHQSAKNTYKNSEFTPIGEDLSSPPKKTPTMTHSSDGSSTTSKLMEKSNSERGTQSTLNLTGKLVPITTDRRVKVLVPKNTPASKSSCSKIRSGPNLSLNSRVRTCSWLPRHSAPRPCTAKPTALWSTSGGTRPGPSWKWITQHLQVHVEASLAQTNLSARLWSTRWNHWRPHQVLWESWGVGQNHEGFFNFNSADGWTSTLTRRAQPWEQRKDKNNKQNSHT